MRDELPQAPLSNDLALLTFSLADQLYGLHIDDVVEVAVMVALTHVANTHSAIIGVANRQGTVLPLLDLAQVMGYPPTNIDDSTLFVVAGQNQKAGLVVHSVQQVKHVSRTKLDQSAAGKYIRGIISDEQRLIQVIDLDTLFNAYLLESLSVESER